LLNVNIAAINKTTPRIKFNSIPLLLKNHNFKQTTKTKKYHKKLHRFRGQLDLPVELSRKAADSFSKLQY